jgi:predicted DNA-binding ribbon-helix-helix protein
MNMTKSPVVKRSIIVGGHKTSVSLEEPFWSGMKEISAQRGMTLSEVVSEIDKNRQQGNLSSAIRLFVLDHFKSRAGSSTGGSQLHSGHGQGVEASAVEGR